MLVAELDAMADERAAALLASCCGATRWVAAMLANRPYRGLDALLRAADDAWWQLEDIDWREAFNHHPPIGSVTSAVPQDDRARQWSASEQAAAANADDAVKREIATANAAYTARFGYICIICAAGRSAGDLLAETRARLTSPPETEIRIAAEEQRKITRLRLARLFHDPPGVANA